MSDHIPFKIQSEIMKSLPVKSLIQFRSVSKQWKSFIDSPEFINNYHINHTNPQHHLLVTYKLGDTARTYTSIVDDNSFPEQKFSLTAPESLRTLRNTFILNSVNGLLCFCGLYGEVDPETRMAVIWNPTVRKSVDIVIPNPKLRNKRTLVGFGVCPDTSDPKLVKINIDKITNIWEVEVFTLSTCIWKPVYTGAPFKKCYFSSGQVFVDGVIYFCAYYFARESMFNIVVSFDLKSEKFGEVCLPEILVNRDRLKVAKVNESLGLYEYHDEGDMNVCGVWSMEDGTNNQFTKIYTIKIGGKSVFTRAVLGFRNNSEAVMELYDGSYDCRIGVYEPLSGHINDLRINGKLGSLYARSYVETLLLLDEPHSSIY